MIIPSAAAIVFLNSNTGIGTLASKSPLYTGSLPSCEKGVIGKYFDQSAISNCTPF
jgi:hypothetical protein